MKEERELERHKRILEQIASAKNRSDLPKISYSTIFFHSPCRLQYS